MASFLLKYLLMLPYIRGERTGDISYNTSESFNKEESKRYIKLTLITNILISYILIKLLVIDWVLKFPSKVIIKLVNCDK